MHFFGEVHGLRPITKEVLRQRTDDYNRWVEAYARNHDIPIEWAEKGVRKEDYVRPVLRRMERNKRFRRLLHPQEHGAGLHVSRDRAQVSRRRSPLSHPQPATQPLHPLLFLYP